MSEQTVLILIRLLLRSSLIRIYTVCHTVYIFWRHFCIVKLNCFILRTTTVVSLGVPIFRVFTVHLPFINRSRSILNVSLHGNLENCMTSTEIAIHKLLIAGVVIWVYQLLDMPILNNNNIKVHRSFKDVLCTHFSLGLNLHLSVWLTLPSAVKKFSGFFWQVLFLQYLEGTILEWNKDNNDKDKTHVIYHLNL